MRDAGRRALVVPADLSDLDAVAGLAGAAYDEFGRIDAVVNNVGGTIPNAFLDTDVDYLEEAFRFNVSTAHALSRAAVPFMLNGDSDAQRSIVNISSMMGRASGRGYLAYGTAKAALAHWARLAARDLAPRIRVNGIFVGSVSTSALDFVTSDEGMLREMEEKTPLGRVGEAEDIAAAALYLSSRAGQYVTGKMLEVDGGIQEPNLDLDCPIYSRARDASLNARPTPPTRSHRTPASTGPSRAPGPSPTASTGFPCRCRWTDSRRSTSTRSRRSTV